MKKKLIFLVILLLFTQDIFAVKLSSFKTPDHNIVFDLILLIIVLLIVALIAFAKIFSDRLQRHHEKKRKILDVIKDLEIPLKYVQTMEELSKLTDIAPEKLLHNNIHFEKAVEIVQKNKENEELLSNLFGLREALGYHFNNPRAKFLKTQMLQYGQKINVNIPHPIKKLNFCTTINFVTEDSFWIKPPRVHGRIVNLSKVKYLNFNLFRSDEAEYKFSVPLVKQIKDPTDAIVMRHTKNIVKLLSRNYDRFIVNFKREFTFVDPKIFESEADNNSIIGDIYAGQVKDISLGGLCFELEKPNDSIHQNKLVLFKFEEAKITKKLQAKIANISIIDGVQRIHLKYLNFTELDRLRLGRFIEALEAVRMK